MYFYEDPDEEKEDGVVESDDTENREATKVDDTQEDLQKQEDPPAEDQDDEQDEVKDVIRDLADRRAEEETGKLPTTDSDGHSATGKQDGAQTGKTGEVGKSGKNNPAESGGQIPQGGPPPDLKTGGSGKGNVASAALHGAGEDGAKGAAKEAAKEVAKQEAKKQFMKMGGQAFMNSLSAAIAPLIPWIVLIILIIIIVVGIVMFFVAVPGQIIGKFKDLGNSVIKAWSAMMHGEDQVVSSSQIASVAAYVEKMGYDLKGEGFVSYNKTAEDIPSTISDIESWTSIDYNPDLAEAGDLNELLIVDEVQGVIRRNDTNEIVDLNSDPILTYIISDNQCYMIKNLNANLDGMTDGNGDFWGGVLATAAAIVGIIVAIVVPGGFIISALLGAAAAGAFAGVSYLAVTTASNPNWGTGLISIYHEAGMGKKGDYYDMKEKGYIDLDPATKKLIIKRGWANGEKTFDVDGWSGRYGMPLEFLLSVHLATQMPDLAIDMATAFDTDVEVLLHEVTGTVTAGVLKEGHTASTDEDFITYETIAELGTEEQSFGQALWEGLKNFANGTVDFFTGDKVWTEEELDELGINGKVMTILFEQGLPHALDCKCCSHISSRSTLEDEECTDGTDIFDDDGDIIEPHVICPQCEDRVLKIIAALSVCNDKEWESFTPYISKVSDHWFRDVYFVMNKSDYDENGESEFSKSVINVDEDYFYETDERWTMYEVWEEGETIPEGFEVGDYKLYDPSDMSTPSTKTLAEVQEINEKIANGDTTVTRLIKKAITNNMSTNFDDGWSAYGEIEDAEEAATWEQMNVDKNSKGELLENAVYKNEDASKPEDILIYYKEILPGNIEQVEDGQRTETNPKIKEMFLNKAYYKYDGSVTTADAILEDRQKDGNDPEKYNTDDDQRDKELIAKVNINKDSLGAFSILENTHTLDADYIYRDFKELIVELNYFDKEDLSDKISEVMQWPIPECGSAGWPIRKYEKGETYYGTLINSKVDLDYMKEVDVKKAEVQLSQLEDEISGDTPETDPTGGISAENVQTNTTSGLGTSGRLVTDSGLTGAVSSAPSISIDQFVQTGYDVHKQMEGNNWDYCVSHLPHGGGCKQAHCNHVYGHGCGLYSTIQDAVEGENTTCCASFTSWVLKEAGFDLSNHNNIHGAKSSYDWCKANDWTEITDESSMEPGDFLFNDGGEDGTDVSQIGHVQMLGNDGEWLNAGSVSAINDAPKVYDAGFIIAMRPPLNGAGKPFEGYEPDQAVVAPITGKIVEYGEVTRKNEETGEEEITDFIKIQAIDHYTTAGKGKTVLSECTNEDKTYEDDNTDASKKEGYDYFYEEYRGVVDGCVLYMEGFDLTLDETLAASDMESEDVTKYQSNKVYNMTNNIKEAQAIWREDAKSAALPFFTDGEDIYIKEGTVIGKTLADPEDFPPEIVVDESGMPTSENPKGSGNYIRLILRDLEDSIIEDVESYFPIDDTNKSQTQPYQAQPGDLELLAYVLSKEGCENYFAGKSVFSGKPEQARDASRVTGYVLINRAIVNFGNYGTTIRDQLLAPGQYSGDYVAEFDAGARTDCPECIANAEWCLTYDCNSVTSPSNNTPMPRNVLGQSGWCHCSADVGKFNCWWWVDTTGDGEKSESDDTGSIPYDTFYCFNTQYPST